MKPGTPFKLAIAMAMATAGSLASATPAPTEGTEVLPPVIVEGQRTPIDSNAAIYRKRLPCIGSCEESESAPAPLLEQVLARIKENLAAAQMQTPPRIYEVRAVQAPTLHRLDDKLP